MGNCKSSMMVPNAGSFKDSELIANGASSSIFRAIRKEDGQIVALKHVRCESKEDANRVLKDSSSLAKLRHPHMVKFEDTFLMDKKTGDDEKDFVVCQVMEYCTGGNLQTMLQTRRNDNSAFFTEAEVLGYLESVLQVLAYCSPLLHQDIKPASLLFQDGVLKVAGFAGGNSSSTGRTPGYSAPEIRNVSSPDGCRKCDVYSLGMIAIDLATLHFPSEDNRAEKDGMAAVWQCIRDRGYSEGFVRVLEGMVQEDENERFSIAEALNQVCASFPSSPIACSVVAAGTVLEDNEDVRFVRTRSHFSSQPSADGIYDEPTVLAGRHIHDGPSDDSITLSTTQHNNAYTFPDTIIAQTRMDAYERYVTREKICKGGQGTVWKVQRKQDGKVVALKTVKCDNMADAISAMTESKFLASLSHPNIVKLEGPPPYIQPLGNENFLVCYEMEFCDGGDLKSIIQQKQTQQPPVILSEDTVLGYLETVLEVLFYCSQMERPIIHRDIKPQNLMFHHGVLKVLDFGIANDDSGSTRTRTIVGTEAYWAPELCNAYLLRTKARYGPKCDVYSLGMVAIDLATLHFAKGDERRTKAGLQTVWQHIRSRSYSVRFVQLVKRMIAMESKRLSVANALKQVRNLRQAIAGAPSLTEDENNGACDVPNAPPLTLQSAVRTKVKDVETTVKRALTSVKNVLAKRFESPRSKSKKGLPVGTQPEEQQVREEEEAEEQHEHEDNEEEAEEEAEETLEVTLSVDVEAPNNGDCCEMMRDGPMPSLKPLPDANFV